MKLEHMTKFQGVNLYVKNLDDDFDDDKLRSIFDQFGTITSAKVMRDSKSVTRGFGFVCFTTPEEATKAVTEMNGKMVGSKPLYVALAQRKEIRRAQLEAQFAQRNKIPPRMPPSMYNGAPVFLPPGQPGFIYGQMMARGRFPPSAYQQMPNYVMVAGGRGGNVKNAGRGGPMMGRGRGMKQPVPQQVQQIAPQPPGKALFDPSLPFEQQKQALGERLYPLIESAHPSFGGKVTGMILDSAYRADDIVRLIEDPEAREEKVNEALKVLKEHSEKQMAQETAAVEN